MGSSQQSVKCGPIVLTFAETLHLISAVKHVTCHTAQESAEYGDYLGLSHQTSILLVLVLTVTDMEDIQYQYLLNLTGTALSPLSTEDI